MHVCGELLVLSIGEPVGEIALDAAICGHCGVPVDLPSGDDIMEREAQALLRDVECAITKYGIDRWTAHCVGLERSRNRIRAGAVSLQPCCSAGPPPTRCMDKATPVNGESAHAKKDVGAVS